METREKLTDNDSAWVWLLSSPPLTRKATMRISSPCVITPRPTSFRYSQFRLTNRIRLSSPNNISG